MFWEEKCNVLHQLFASEVKVSGHLQGRENLVEEAFIHVHGDEAEEMGVKQGKHFVPHGLLDMDYMLI